jgi:hypothetical protein
MVPCCVWTPWTAFSNCSKNCDGGVSVRTRECVCGAPLKQKDSKDSKTKDSDDKKRTYGDTKDSKGDSKDVKSSPQPAPSCNGSAIETVPCNNMSCCTWSNFTEWSNCSITSNSTFGNSTCGIGVRRRYGICTCIPQTTNPVPTSTPTPYKTKDSDDKKDGKDSKTKDSDDKKRTYGDSKDDSKDQISPTSTPSPCIVQSGDSKDSKSEDSDDKKRNGGSKKSKPKDSKDTKQPKPSQDCVTQNLTFTGTQNITYACYCGGQLVAPELCQRNPCVPLTETQTCTLNCSCTWINITSWSPCSATCGAGTQYLTRKCSCQPETQSSKPSKTKKSKDDDDSRKKRNGNTKDDDDSDSKPPSAPTPVWDPACQGYTVLTQSCYSNCTKKGDTKDQDTKDQKGVKKEKKEEKKEEQKKTSEKTSEKTSVKTSEKKEEKKKDEKKSKKFQDDKTLEATRHNNKIADSIPTFNLWILIPSIVLIILILGIMMYIRFKNQT